MIPFLLLILAIVAVPAAATSVSKTDASGAMGPDTTDNKVHEFTLDASADTVIHTGSGTSAGNALAGFGTVTSYVLVDDGGNDGDGTAGYHDGDEVFSVTQVHDGSTDISSGGTVYTFPATTVFVDDGTEVSGGTAGQYDDGDDMFTYTTQSGSPTTADSGTAYQTFKGTTEFLNAPGTPSATFDGSQPIISGSSDDTLGNGETVQKDGSAGILTGLSGTNNQHWDDASGTGGSYDDKSQSYGEPIYDNAASGAGTVGTDDTRITSVTVNSGSDDSDVATIDLGLGTFTTVGASDADNGKSLTAAGFQVVKFDYNTDDTEPAWETASDDLYLDVDGSGTVTEGDIVLHQGDTTNDIAAGTQLTSSQASTLQSESPANGKGTITSPSGVDINRDDASGSGTGSYHSGDNVYLDFGSDAGGEDNAASSGTPDLQLTGGSISTITSTPSNYADQTAVIERWEADSSGSQTIADAVYVDIGDSGAVATDDVRLAGFTRTFSAGTSPSSGDVDVGVSITSFASSETFLNDNGASGYENGEAIVSSSGDTNYGSADSVLVQGTITNVREDFRSGSSPFDAFEGSGDYSGSEPIVTVSNAFSTTSGTRNTVPSADSSVSLNGFETGTGNVEGFVTSTGSSYADDEEIVRLDRFTTTSGTQQTIGDGSSVTVNAFASATKFDDSEGDATYDDDEAIVDDGDTNSYYGDTLTHVTVNNDGSLSNSAPGTITVYKDDGSSAGSIDGSDTSLGTASSFATQIDVTDDSTASTQKYFIAVDIPSNIASSEDDNTITANPTTTTVSGDNPDPAANGNAQTVNVPHVTDVASKDTDTDGQIDRVTVTFSEAVDVSEGGDTGDAFTGFTLDDGSFTVSNANYDATGVTTVDIDLSSAVGDTSSTTSATYDTAQNTITSNTGSYELTEDMSALTQTDSAKPTVTDMEIKDTDDDALIDETVFTFSETVNAGDGTLDENEFQDSGSNSVVTLPDGTAATLSTNDADYSGGGTSTLTVSGMTGQGTANTAPGSSGITVPETTDFNDGNGNDLVSALDDETVTDSAAPVDTGHAYLDTDDDAQVDRIDIAYSETVALDESETGDFGVSGLGGSTSIDSVAASSSEIQLTVSGTSSGTTNFGSATVSYTQSAGTADSIDDGPAANPATDISSASLSDEAAPQITDFQYEDSDNDAQIDQFTVTFSETVVAGSNMGQNDLVFQNVGDFSSAAFGTASDDAISSGTSSATVSLGTVSSVQDTNEGSGTIDIETTGGNGFTLDDGNGNTYTGTGDASTDQAGYTDGAAPQITDFQYEDGNTDGRIDQFTLTFSESLAASTNLGQNDLLIQNVGDFTSAAFDGGGDDAVTSTGSTKTIALNTVSSAADTSEDSGSIDIELESGGSVSLEDSSGNSYSTTGDASTDQASYTDGAAPFADSAAYRDTNADGTVDRIDVTYTEDISGSSTYTDGDWSVATAGTVSVSKDGTGTVSGTDLQVDVTGSTDVTGGGTDPQLSYTPGTSITDGTNNAPSQTVTGSDSAAPVIKSAATSDDGSGNVNNIQVVMTEAITDTNGGDITDTSEDEFTLPDDAGASVDTVSTGTSSDDDTVELGVSGSSLTGDTAVTPNVNLVAANAVADASSNTVGSDFKHSSTSDGASPGILSQAYKDTDDDGTVDRVDLSFSETVSYSPYEDGDWSVTPNGLSGLDVSAGTTSSSSTLQLTASAQSDLTGVGGGTEPTIDFVSQGTTDVGDGNGNTLAAVSGLTLADSAAPSFRTVTTADSDSDGRVDNLTTVFTEAVATDSVEAADLSIGTANGLDASTAVSAVLSDDGDGTVSISLSEGGGFDTAATPTLSYGQDDANQEVQDSSGNQMVDQTSSAASDGARPIAVDASYTDSTSDGQVDRVDVTYSEDISGSSSFESGDWSFPTDSAGLSASSGVFSTTDVQVTVSGAPSANTSLAPTTVQYTDQGAGGSITDGSNTAATSSALTASDSAQPTISELEIFDTGTDGLIDKINVTFTETVDTDDSAAPVAGDFGTVTLPDGSGASLGSASFTDPAGTNDEVKITGISGQSTANTAAGSTDISGMTSGDWTDGNGNNLVSTQDDESVTDLAAPSFTSVTTADADDDGKVDQLTTVFSEAVATGTPEAADFSIASANNLASGTSVSGVNSDDGDGTVTLTLSEGGDPDTDATPTVDYARLDGASAKVADTSSNSNEMKNQTSSAASDGAAPQITDFEYQDSDIDGAIDQFVISFSETVDAATNLGQDDLVVQNAGDFTSAAYDGAGDDSVSSATASVTIGLNTVSSVEDTSEDSGALDIELEAGGVSLTDGTNTYSTTGDASTDHVTYTDGAAPVVSTASTVDNGQGDIVNISATFTESIVDTASTLDTSTFDLGSGTLDTVGTGSTANDSGATMEVSGFSEDTASTPSVTLKASKVQDSAANVIGSDQSAVTSTDGAAPALLHATLDHTRSNSSTSYVNATFSESVDTSSSPDLKIDGSSFDATAEQDGLTGNRFYVVRQDSVINTAALPNITSISSVTDGQGNSAVLSGSTVEIHTFRKEVVSGWNYVSFPIGSRTSVSIDSVLDTSKIDTVWRYDDGWESYDPDASSNAFTTFEGGMGYQIDANTGFTLAPNVNNTDLGGSGGGSVPSDSIELENGWNLIGQWQEFNQSATNSAGEAFDGIKSDNLDQVVAQASPGSASADFGSPVRSSDGSSFTFMKTGEAYWMWSQAASPIQYRIN